MTSPTLSRPLLWGIVVFLGLAVLASAQDLPAQDACIAVDRDGFRRSCTFLEEHGSCLVGALDSYETCVEALDGWVGRLGCEIGVQVDLLACNVTIPLALIRSILP
mgnify:CR=1 FL=1